MNYIFFVNMSEIRVGHLLPNMLFGIFIGLTCKIFGTSNYFELVGVTCLTLPLFVTLWDMEYLFECHKRHADVEESQKGSKIELQRHTFPLNIMLSFKTPHLLGAKPKHPRVGELSAAPLPVEEVAPLSQIPGLNLTQFNNIGNFRPNVAIHIPRHSTRACRAKNLFN